MTIEEKINEINRRVKTKCDENNIRITLITTSFSENKLLRDGTEKDMIVTWIQKLFLNSNSFIVTDPETLEMLYVQTGPRNFTEIDEFFVSQDNED